MKSGIIDPYFDEKGTWPPTQTSRRACAGAHFRLGGIMPPMERRRAESRGPISMRRGTPKLIRLFVLRWD